MNKLLRQKISIFLCAAWLVSGCSGVSSQKEIVVSDDVDLDDAQDIAAYFYGQHLSRFGDHPLMRAKSFEDTLEILRADNIALFPAGIRAALVIHGVKGRAMVAQMELAWGEALLMLGQAQLKVLERLAPYKLKEQAGLDAGTLDADQKAEFSEFCDAYDQSEALANALVRVARHRIEVGGVAASQVIKEFPRSYLGYRVAADFYRLTQNWALFDEVMNKLQQLNPVSVGLAFQKGAAARHRDKDLESARRWFSVALSRDARFTRASVHQVMSQDSYIEFERAFQKFRGLHPDHQLVLWTAPLIGRLHQARIGKPDLRLPVIE
ncbi:MAG: hypothetical protein HOK28_11265 [Deltaproteobacteria bacterium]|nr:hypothetical protein [Deltaproteobacteria bacterium]